MGKLALLQACHLFEAVPARVVQDLAHLTARRRMTKGEVIFWEGDSPDGFYLISSGEVSIKRDHTIVCSLTSGHSFGEIAIISEGPRTATAICEKDGILLRVATDAFKMLVVEYPAFAQRVIELIGGSKPSTPEAARSHDSLAKRSRADAAFDEFSAADITHADEAASILAEVEIFASVTRTQLVAIASASRRISLRAGDPVFREGESSDGAYVVATGLVEIFRGDAQLSTIRRSTLFGEVAVLKNSPRTASARMIEDGSLLYIDAPTFRRALAANPVIVQSLLRRMVGYFQTDLVIERSRERKVDYDLRREEVRSKHPEYDAELLSKLVFERHGDGDESNMTVLDMLVTVEPKIPYILSADGPEELDPYAAAPRVHELERWPETGEAPRALDVVATWDSSVALDGSGNNILGGNGKFLIDDSNLEIPVVEATDAGLGYYGAKLVDIGEVVQFAEAFPIWTMLIGSQYMKKFILSPKAGGLYLEYHHDKPHFHMPVNRHSRGYYILGKDLGPAEVGDARRRYRITAFQIPLGKAVYTCHSAIHCDAGLVGPWMVGYTNAQDFSTVVVTKRGSDAIVGIDFVAMA
jgi:hypothetical protein